MGKDTLCFWILVTLIFILTQPGAIVFGNLDAPYGFYRDLSEWLETSLGGLLIILPYGVFQWKRGRVSRNNFLLYLAVIIATAVIAYWADMVAFSSIRGGLSIASFIELSFLGFIFSLIVLFLMITNHHSFPYYYPYDRPLVIAWLVMIVATLLLGAAYLKEKLTEQRIQAL
ncbi:hypothetical protein [Thermococcus sp.]